MRKRFVAMMFLICVLLLSCKQGVDELGKTESAVPEFSGYLSDDLLKLQSMLVLHEQWRVEGNPDFYENAAIYDFQQAEGEFIFELQEVYSVDDRSWKLGVSSNKEIQIAGWTHLINLEKWANGEWIRQGVLWDIFTYEQTPEDYAGRGLESKYPMEWLMSMRDFEIPVSSVYPMPTAGRYRFLFYVEVVLEGQTEYRVYHIPFEVVE